MALGVELELDAVKTENVSLKKENNSLKTAFKEETDKLDVSTETISLIPTVFCEMN